MNDAPGSILVLRLSALGDILHTLPAVVALRRSFPETRMEWVVEAPYREFVELIAPVDGVLTVATKRWRRKARSGSTWQELQQSVRAIRAAGKGGHSIDFQGLVKSASIGRLAGCVTRYGFARGSIRERAALLFINRPVRVDPALHVVEQNLELARGAGAVAESVPKLDLTRLPDRSNAVVTALAEERPVVINPGAGRPEKIWSVERFAELAAAIEGRWKKKPVVLWGPGERQMAEEIVSAGGGELAPETNLRQLALILQQARLVIAGDTGPLHLAAAFGTPVVALFGPTDPRRNGPYGQVERCVETFSSSKLMSDITVDAVMKRAEEIIG